MHAWPLLVSSSIYSPFARGRRPPTRARERVAQLFADSALPPRIITQTSLLRPTARARPPAAPRPLPRPAPAAGLARTPTPSPRGVMPDATASGDGELAYF